MTKDQIDAQVLFQAIASLLQQENSNINNGKMMSAPAITYKSKVFAFYHAGEMSFRLGKKYDIEKANVSSYQVLSPFKNKPPMQGWFRISFEDHSQWEALARHALELLQREIG